MRALKYNGGMKKEDLTKEDLVTLEKGIVNLDKHIENLHKYNVPIVVALNHRAEDSEAEIAFVKKHCESYNCRFAVADVFAKGGA